MNRYVVIYEEIKKLKPNTIIEIGTYNGKQAEKMLRECSKYGKIKYIGFDLFEDINAKIRKKEFHTKASVPKKDEVKKKLSKFPHKIELIKGNTRKTLKNIKLDITYPLLIWIDGGHSIESIDSDFRNLEPLINNNTIVLLDDYYHSKHKYSFGCATLVEKLQELSLYKIEILDHIDKFKDLKISIVKLSK